MKQQLLFIVMGLCIIGWQTSCINQAKDSNKKDVKANRAADTFVKDIPFDKKGRPLSYYSNKEEVECALILVIPLPPRYKSPNSSTFAW